MTHSRPLDPTSRPQARTRGPGSVARHLRKPGGRTATSPEPPGGEVGAVNAKYHREGRSCTSAAPQTLVPVTVPARGGGGGRAGGGAGGGGRGARGGGPGI